MRLLTMILALTLGLPVHAGAKPAEELFPGASMANRQPANRFPSRVFTFVCRESEDAPEVALGMIRQSLDFKDHSKGMYSMDFYVQLDKQHYQYKQLTGRFVSVPDGHVYYARWQGLMSEQVEIHLHPAEKTRFPGMASPVACQPTAQMYDP